MSTVTVNISFQNDLLAAIDAEAKRESRSRSELLREAARV
ncbi:MAG: ribbon-helix-helix domain-containing protein [Pseudomonas sp.]|jgi:metal-responsive CopG/Arc/MetJ family transcriptional regulator|nr:ribbon-helix-helix domain-containing protein [Pseudomonas sp.]